MDKNVKKDLKLDISCGCGSCNEEKKDLKLDISCDCGNCGEKESGNENEHSYSEKLGFYGAIVGAIIFVATVVFGVVPKEYEVYVLIVAYLLLGGEVLFTVAKNLVKGNLFEFLEGNLAPNFFNGKTTLPKSLFDRLLSPINLIFLSECISSPRIKRPSVPEFPTSSVKFFLYLKLLSPFPIILQYLSLIITFTPSVFKQFKVFNTSSDFKSLYAFELPKAWEANSAHLIDKLLSPSIEIVLLYGLIVFSILIKLFINFINNIN